MNKSYMTLFSESLGAWVAVSEITAKSGRRSRASLFLCASLAPVITVWFAGLPLPAAAQQSIIFGDGAGVGSARYSIAIGINSSATGDESIALGMASISPGIRTIAVGSTANVNGNDSIAIGTGATGNGSFGVVAIGQGATVAGTRSTAMGSFVSIEGQDNVALGSGAAVRNGDGSTAVGNGASTNGQRSTALGVGANSTGVGALAIGSSGIAAGDGATAVGMNARAALGAFAGGAAANATGGNSIALLGTDNAMMDSVVVGASSSIAAGTPGKNVALGANAVASRGLQTNLTGYGRSVTESSVGELSIGATGATRQITHLAAGTAATDGVNVSQLNDVGARLATAVGGGAAFNATTGAFTSPAYLVGGVARSNVGDALSATNALSVQYTANTAGTPTATIDLTKGGTIANSTLTGIAAGTLSTTSGDAVTGAQLNATNTALTEFRTSIEAGGTGAVQYSNAATPTAANGGTKTNDLTLVGAATGTVGLHNVTAGTISATSTDAVNGSQLNTTNTGLATVQSNLGSLTSNIANGSLGPVLYSNAATGNVSNGGIKSNDLTLSGLAEAPVGLHNVKAGTVSATSTDAVNGTQLNSVTSALASLQTNVDGGGIKYAHVNSILADARATGMDSSVFGPDAEAAGNGSIALGVGSRATTDGTVAMGSQARSTGINAVALGADTLASAANSVALGDQSQATRGAQAAYAAYGLAVAQTSVGEVSIGTAGSNRQLTHMAAGSADTDGVNVLQMRSSVNGLGSALTTVLGGTYDVSTGGYTAPVYTVANGATATTVQGAFNAYNTALTQASNGGSGPLQYSTTTSPGTTNGGTRTNSVTLVGAEAGPVGLHNVANGSTAVGSTDAVNGGQINTAMASIAGNLGGGSVYNATTGVVTAPAYQVRGTTVNNVGAALTALDGAVSGNTSAIDALARGGTGLVRQAAQAGRAVSNAAISIGAETGGTEVNLTNNTGGVRLLTGLAEGAVSATSVDAVTGRQLYATNQQVELLNAGGGVKYAATNSTKAAATATGVDSFAAGPDAVSTGRGSVAIGDGSRAVGDLSVAIGQGASSLAENSVALGAGSIATRAAETYMPLYFNGASFTSAGTVSVGSAGAERTITNVAPGVADTDAANVSQLKGVQNTINQRIDGVERNSYRGIASVAALSFQPMQQKPGQFVGSAGLGYYQGYGAIGVGANYVFLNGRQKLYAAVASANGGKPVANVGFSMILGE